MESFQLKSATCEAYSGKKKQSPPAFYEAIIKSTLQDIIMPPQPQLNDDVQQPPGEILVPSTEKATTTRKHMLLIQYRGKCTEAYARALLYSSDDTEKTQNSNAINQTSS